jgi:hypothetical protein
MRLDNTPAIGLTVSQDEKWLLYSQYDCARIARAGL